MQEWNTIPSYPDYEMADYSAIRHKETKSWVDQYMGRANFNEEKHLRVRLRKDGLPIANSVEELLYETYPHLKPKPEEPTPVVKIPKAKSRHRWQRKSEKKPAGRAKPYVDDLGPEWVSIPGFSRYKINREGQVINRRSKQLVTLRNSNKGSPNYSLLDDAGVSKARHPDRLLGISFKDLAHQATLRKSAVPVVYGEWRPIPNRTMYELHASGQVRRISRHRVTTLEDAEGKPYVKLKTDGVKGFKHYYISDLLKEVYNIELKEAA